MLKIAISFISLSRQGVTKIPQGADFLRKITWKMWSMKTIVLLSMTSAAPWTIPRMAKDLMFSRSACNARNINADPNYNSAHKTNEYPGWVMHHNRCTHNGEITSRTTPMRGKKIAISSFPLRYRYRYRYRYHIRWYEDAHYERETARRYNF